MCWLRNATRKTNLTTTVVSVHSNSRYWVQKTESKVNKSEERKQLDLRY